jgi:hypothetical protein
MKDLKPRQPTSDAAWRQFAQAVRRDYLLAKKQQSQEIEQKQFVAISNPQFTALHLAVDPKVQVG